jgi:hypothetical protein
MSSIIINCPHCNEYIVICKKDFNCKIFRHGTYINNQKQIDPHMCKEECDRLVSETKIYGCSKPFRLVETENDIIVEKCDYI